MSNQISIDFDTLEKLLPYKNLTLLKLDKRPNGPYITYRCNFCNEIFTAGWDSYNFAVSLYKKGCIHCSRNYRHRYIGKQHLGEPIVTFADISKEFNIAASNVSGYLQSAQIEFFKIESFYCIRERDLPKLREHLNRTGGENLSLTRNRIISELQLEGYTTYGDAAKILKCKLGRITEWVKILNLETQKNGFIAYIKNKDLQKLKEFGSRTRYWGEKLIVDFLKDKQLNFEQQKTFTGLKNKRALHCDFYLNDYNTVIELDGGFHYENGVHKRLITGSNDWIKDKYLQEHNIRLFRIPWLIEGVNCRKDLYNKMDEALKQLQKMFN